MIHTILKELGYTYIDTIRKRTTDRYVLCRDGKEFFFILVDERQLEEYSDTNKIVTIYESMIKKQIKKCKRYEKLTDLALHVSEL